MFLSNYIIFQTEQNEKKRSYTFVMLHGICINNYYDDVTEFLGSGMAVVDLNWLEWDWPIFVGLQMNDKSYDFAEIR